MKKNITITVSEEDLTEFKRHAELDHRSVSNWISYVLAKHIQFDEAFEMEHMPDKWRPDLETENQQSAEVLRLSSEGYSVRDIAKEIGLSKSQIADILKNDVICHSQT